MDKSKLTRERRLRRKRGLRKNIFGYTDKPRFTVFRSNQNIYAQIIDDVAGQTVAAADSLKIEKGSSMEAAEAVGKAVAEAAKSKGVDKVCFDRNGFRYHGRIKALADAAREAGLQF